MFERDLSLRFIDAVHLLNLVYLIGHVVVDVRDLSLLNQDHIREDTKGLHLLDPDLIRTGNLDLLLDLGSPNDRRHSHKRSKRSRSHQRSRLSHSWHSHRSRHYSRSRSHGHHRSRSPVLDAIRGIDPLAQVLILFWFMGMAVVRTKRDVLSLLLFHLEIRTVTFLQ